MKRLTLKLKELRPAYKINRINVDSSDLEAKMREGGREIPPIPVIELPADLKNNGEKYSFCDGHNRYAAAKAVGIDSVKCLLYIDEDDLNEVSRMTGEASLMSQSQFIKYLRKNQSTQISIYVRSS